MTDNFSDSVSKTPDYELHLPRFLTYPIPVSIVGAITAAAIYFVLPEYPVSAGLTAGIIFFIGIAYAGFSKIVKRVTNVERRLKARDELIAEIAWKGDENVLDVGCGNGILILGAAKRLTSGKAIGIKIWTEKAGDSRPEAFLKNAEIEGVADRVSLENVDVSRMPYEDESFDIILCGLTMHHIMHDGGADSAMSEMNRVLKTSGTIAVYDVPIAIMSTAKLMRKNGLKVNRKNNTLIFGSKPSF